MKSNLSERQDGQEALRSSTLSSAFDAATTEETPARQMRRPGEKPLPNQLQTDPTGGLPSLLQHGIERLSGVSMAGVRVHYNSAEPALVEAAAFARNGEIHLGPGMAHLLPHEAWHVAQQRQGRVSATTDINGQKVNDDDSMEQEAERMGQLAAKTTADDAGDDEDPASSQGLSTGSDVDVIQRAPGDFTGHPLFDVPGLGGKTSHWRNLQGALRAYSQLQEDDNVGRLAGLRNVQAATIAWRNEVGFVGNDPTSLPQKRFMQAGALIGFEQDLMREWQEVLTQAGQPAFSTGELDSMQGQTPVEDPLLTRRVKNNTFIGFFRPGAQLIKTNGTAIPAPETDSGCKLHDDGTYPISIVGGGGDYYRVESYDHIERIGEKANIKNGVFFKDTVWVLRTQVQKSHMTQNNPAMSYEDKSDPVLHPLFPHAPCKEDVEQNGLGDCWLLAAMGTIANWDSNHFRNVMKDNMDGTVTVQLYDIMPGNVYVPRRITVKKSIVVRQNGTAGFGGGALWVSIYEKAFTAAGYQGDNDERLPVHTGSYGSIEGGKPKIAMKHILGRNADSEDVGADHPPFIRGDISRLFGRDTDQDSDTYGQRTLVAQAGLTLDVNQVWALFLCGATNSQAWRACFASDQPRKGDLAKHRAKILEDTPVPNQADMNTFLDWVRDYVLPDKRGTGSYAPWQVATFQRIVNRLVAGNAVTISTKDRVVSRGSNGGLSGENVGKGLAGPHAYSVLDYSPNPMPLIPAPDQVYWLKIRNPWGDVKARSPQAPDPGRVYEDAEWETPVENVPFDKAEQDVEDNPHHLSAKGDANPEFWIELSDITKRFDHFDFTT